MLELLTWCVLFLAWHSFSSLHHTSSTSSLSSTLPSWSALSTTAATTIASPPSFVSPFLAHLDVPTTGSVETMSDASPYHSPQREQQQQQQRHDDLIFNQSRFGVSEDVGFISGEYTCLWQGINGRLYTGSRALYFLGTYFLFDKKLLLYWHDIRQVRLIHQGVQVVRKDDTVHTFEGIYTPDRLWMILVSLHNEALLDAPRGGGGGESTSRTSMAAAGDASRPRRRNSDPSTLLPLSSDLDPWLAEDDTYSSPTAKKTPATPVVAPVDPVAKTPAPRPRDDKEAATWAGPRKLDPVACWCNQIPGHLYTHEHAVFFWGRRFFWERHLVFLRWDHIQQVQMVHSVLTRDKKRPTVDMIESLSERPRDGLVFLSKKEGSFRFDQVENADRFWASLIALHNEKLSSNHQGSYNSRSSIMGPLRRMNSDPQMMTTTTTTALTPGRVVEAEGEQVDTVDLTFTSLSSGSGTESYPSPLIKKPSSVPSVEEEWAKIRQGSNQYSHAVVQNRVLKKCSLDNFFDMFLADQAKNAITLFMQNRGDADMRICNWKRPEDGSHQPLSRAVHYSHPVNAPLAPPKANARKEQSYRRYGDIGLCLETKTYVDDLPMADCFFVADRILVESIDKGQAVNVTMEFRIDFVKSTMFKGIISKTTSTEFEAFFRDMADFMSKSLGEETAVVVPPPVSVVPVTASESTWQRLASMLTMPLMFLVLLIQLWIMSEVRSLRLAIQDLISPPCKK